MRPGIRGMVGMFGRTSWTPNPSGMCRYVFMAVVAVAGGLVVEEKKDVGKAGFEAGRILARTHVQTETREATTESSEQD